MSGIQEKAPKTPRKTSKEKKHEAYFMMFLLYVVIFWVMMPAIAWAAVDSDNHKYFVDCLFDVEVAFHILGVIVAVLYLIVDKINSLLTE